MNSFPYPVFGYVTIDDAALPVMRSQGVSIGKLLTLHGKALETGTSRTTTNGLLIRTTSENGKTFTRITIDTM